MKKTSRGFNIYTEFRDTYKSEVRVQESSSACAPRVWIFCESAPGNKDMSPHLSPAQARRVAKALLKFADAN